MRTFESNIVFLSGGSLVLLGLSRSVLEGIPLPAFFGALLLFMVPGTVLVRWFFGDRIFGIMSLPVSFSLSVGIFALLGVPFLLLHLSLATYLWVAGGVLAVTLAAVVAEILRQRGARRRPGTRRGASRFSARAKTGDGPNVTLFARRWLEVE